MDYGIQLGRRFRALKAWMVLRSFGRSGIAARVREHCRLAGVLAGFVRAEAGMEIAAPPGMSVVCFRCAPEPLSGEAGDDLNVAIVEAVNASGDAYLTHTRLRGRTVMRIGFGNVLTTEDHLATAWSRVLTERDRLMDLRGGVRQDDASRRSR
jgi:aromatic-L-amino-acid decarboxylase